MPTTIYGHPILQVPLLLVVLLLSLHGCEPADSNAATRDTQQSSNALPSIWNNDGGKATMYRFLGEINLRNSDKSYRFAEFASRYQAMFRLDLIEATSGKQFGYLADHTSGEVFSFAPFTCNLTEKSRLNELVSMELDSLMPKVAVSDEAFEECLLSTGLGSIWLYASKNDAHYREPLHQLSDDTNTSDLWKEIDMDRLQAFVVPPTANYPYELSMFFRANQRIEPRSLLLILVADKSKPDGDLMRIRILESWNDIEGQGSSSYVNWNRIFLLPAGYGCRRLKPAQNPSMEATSSLESSLSWPHLLLLNVVSLHPPADNPGAPVDKWKGHSSRVRLVAGRLAWTDNSSSSDYLALELQDFGPEEKTIFGGSTRVASLRRRRRVWDLGQNGLSDSAEGGKQKAVYLDIDERKARCLGYGQSPREESVNLELEWNDEATMRPEKRKENLKVGVPNLHELTLNNEFLQLLFGASVDGFQLVQETLESRSMELVFEKRVANFQLHTTKGGTSKPIWVGPVSMIRKETWTVLRNPRETSAQPNDTTAPAVRPHHGGSGLQWPPTKISGSVLFLTPGSDGIISKLTMELIERRPISKSQLHQQVSIAALLCYTQLESATSNGSSKSRSKSASGGGHNAAPLVALNYPLDTEPATREDLIGGAGPIQSLAGRRRQAFEEQIYEQFLGLMRSISGARFEGLRVAQLVIGFDEDALNLRVQARLLEQPALLSFIPEAGSGYRLSGAGGYTTELKKNVASCADSCRHLACLAFVYCATSQECQLAYTKPLPPPDNTSTNNSNLQDCHLYEKTSLAIERPEAMPVSELVGRLAELIDSRPEELALKIQLGVAEPIKLIPSSLESGDSLPGSKSISLDAMRPARWPEYELIFKARRFKSFGGLRVSHHIGSHQDCELLCSQLDCVSFGFCPLEQVCYLDNDPEHDNTQTLEQVTEPGQDTCSVFARDQLSKFERNGLPVARGSIQQAELDIGWTSSGGTTRDCAASCIHHQSGDQFKCLSFYYCISEAATTSCLLRGVWHPANDSSSMAASGDKKSDAGFSDASCQLYKRSYLAEFDKFPGRALVGDTLALEEDAASVWASPDACALECVSRLELNEPCRAFQICRGAVEGDPIEPKCSFRFGWLSSTGDTETEKAPPSRLPEMVDSDLCSVFVPATDWQLSRLAGDANREHSWAHKTSSAAGSLLDLLWELPILLGLGLAIGLTLAAASFRSGMLR